MSQINSTHNDPAPRSGRRALIAVLTVAIVAAAAGAGYLWWAGNRQLDAIAAEQARQDSNSVFHIRYKVRLCSPRKGITRTL